MNAPSASALPMKSAKQNYRANSEILRLLEDFRCMVNDCITIGLREEVTSMKSLCAKAYHSLSVYDGVPTCYRLTAISRAVGILKAHRKALKKNPNSRTPYVRRLSLIDCYGFRIFGRLLRLVFSRNSYIFIILDDHTLRTISAHVVRSVTLTPDSVSLCYSKRRPPGIERRGLIGIDRNMGNLAVATSNGGMQSIDVSEATRLKELYRQVTRHFKRNDRRMRKKIFSKYGKRERNRVNQVLQRATKKIIELAKNERFGIVLEDLRDIRKLGRKGNGQGRRARYRINSWCVYELGRQLEYKARWEGVPVFYVPARNTTAKCSMCGYKKTIEIPNEHRMLYCPGCRHKIDRDDNAARNILKEGLLRFGSDGPPGEAMKRNPTMTVIRGVDGGKRTALESAKELTRAESSEPRLSTEA